MVEDLYALAPKRQLERAEADMIIDEKLNIPALSKRIEPTFARQSPNVVRVLARMAYLARRQIRESKTILSDDPSGHVPAYFIWALNRAYRQKHAPDAQEKVWLVSMSKDDPLDEIMLKMSADSGTLRSPALLVTETVGERTTLNILEERLNRLNISHSSLTFSAGIGQKDWIFENLIAADEDLLAAGAFYDRPEITGKREKYRGEIIPFEHRESKDALPTHKIVMEQMDTLAEACLPLVEIP